MNSTMWVLSQTTQFLDLVNTQKPYGDFLPFSLFFRHSLSFILHFLLCLLLVPVWFLANKRHGGNSMRKPSGFLYNLSLGCSLGLCGLFLFLCVFNWMKYWDGAGSLEILATQVDFVVQFVAWMAVSLFLKYGLRKERKYPIWIRLWCVVFLTMSVYSLVVDFVFLEHTQITNHYVWVELLSVFIGSFLCYACFYGDTGDESAEDGLREPLLSNGSLGKKDGSSDHVTTPYATASFFSKLTFSWMNPLLSLGCKKALDPDDVPQVAEKDRARTILPVFLDRLYEEDKGNSNENVVGTLKLVKALILSVWKEVVWTAFLCLVSTLAAYVGPYMIESFVEYLSGNVKSPNEGYVLIGTFFGAKVVECLCHRHWFFTTRQIGVRNRAALNAVIYNKGLSLSSRAKQGHSSGEVINLMSVDAERVGDFSWYFHELWVVPLQIVIALFILYRNLGAASFASIVATFVIMLANIPLGKLEEYFQDNIMEAKDERMKATTETLRNMRILKLYGWEMRFLSKILDLRRSETSWLKKYVYASAGTSFVLWNAPTFIAVVSFGACMLFGMPLTTGRILSSLATFEVLEEPIYGLPEAISMIVQTKVSLTRIASFLNEEDIQQDAVQRIGKDPSAPAVEIHDGNFSWDLTLEEPTLRGLNLRVEHGMRVAVCGTVGSGKTNLLSSILGEVPKISGSVRLSGMTAYVPQSPWIQSGTIEDNILFGKKMDRYRYENILDVCALKKDLAILPFGDQTFIGERGINLSGGQKQRIQIARALYQDADIYLLDDPFSAVDAHTGTHLFQECLLGFLSSRTVIYVTHQVEFLSSADLILVMRDGSITQAGPYSAILQSGTDFMQLVGAQEEAMSALNEIEAGRASEVSRIASLNESQEERQASIDKPKDVNVNGKSEEIEDHGQLVQEEEREKGRVSLSIYWDYLRAAYGGALVPLILLAEIIFQVLQIGSNYWMAWATPISDTQPAPVSTSTLILVYVALSGVSSVFVLAKSLLIGTVGYKTAMILFNKMHQSIFRAPMSFFDSTPTGRILNRVSGDQSEVDLSIPQMMGAVAFGVIHLVVIIAVMSQVAWQVFIVFIPVVAACIWLQQYYIATARELSRLIGICTAPILQHFAETVSGSSVIRSFKEESRFTEKNLNLIDGLSGPKFHNSAATEWLCFRMDILSSLTFAFSLAFLVFLPAGVIDPGIAGLAVTYGLSLNMLQAMVIWSLCNLENAIVSVERILQFTRIPSEPPLVVDTNKPSGDWPSCGRIDITDLQIRYASHLPVVLRGLTCTFHGGTKTGIVGRTGSGKSTLVQALFRIVDPLGGQILIDGVNILTIGLHDLRTRLSIIPQDPTMFEGTIRSNLDPLEEHTDPVIWEALEKCQLGNIVRQKEAKLDSIVTENGENWSVGQRQLVCLGRVLLRRSRILVLDEATASVDTATDSLIQHTLREQFTDCTVITIAHRIGSVLDSDMVLLLDNGTVLEHDSPQRLLEDKSSAFSKLVAEYTTRSNHHA